MSHFARRLSVFFLAALIATAAIASEPERMTPILLSVPDAPVPFTGSDGSTHLVYELWLTNFSSAEATIEQVQVLTGNNTVLQTLTPTEIATRLQPAGQRDSSANLAKGSQALLFLHVILAPNTTAPNQLTHLVTAHINAAPPGQQEMSMSGGPTPVNHREVVHIAPPLAGDGYVSADSCCDATRHTRASLPVDGRVWIAQRYAVDWEQIDASRRIYTGPQQKPESYTIFGKPVLAVADATVVSTTDGNPEETPGQYPTNIDVAKADGNSVILDLGNHNYALYAHLQPGSIKVHQGDHVKTGQVLALVGNTGNSLAPHLHFHVMDGPSPLASSGLPYQIDNYHITARTPGTAAFDEAEAKGIPIPTTPISPPQPVPTGLPLDQLIISFPPIEQRTSK